MTARYILDDYPEHSTISKAHLYGTLTPDEHWAPFCLECGELIEASDYFSIGKPDNTLCSDCLTRTTLENARSGDGDSLGALIAFADFCQDSEFSGELGRFLRGYYQSELS